MTHKNEKQYLKVPSQQQKPESMNSHRRVILNIYVVQLGKDWDLEARTPPELLRIAGVPRRPHRRVQLVTGTQAAAELSGELFTAVTQCSRNQALCVLGYFPK